jgi:glycine hydroxymethyltransferase
MPPKVTSGIRVGTPAATTRGFDNNDFIKVGDLIAETLDGLQNNPEDNSKIEENVRMQVKELCDKYPIYS